MPPVRKLAAIVRGAFSAAVTGKGTSGSCSVAIAGATSVTVAGVSKHRAAAACSDAKTGGGGFTAGKTDSVCPGVDEDAADGICNGGSGGIGSTALAPAMPEGSNTSMIKRLPAR